MTTFVLSTMTQPVGYTNWIVVDGVPIQKEKILIAGGAGIASLRSGFGEMSYNSEGRPLWTADGMVTALDDAKYDILKEHPIFKKHLEEGLVKVISRDIRNNHEDVRKYAANMSRDAFQVLNKGSLKQRIKVAVAPTDSEEDGTIRL